jgi:uncharacterized protein
MSYNPVGWFEIPVSDLERATKFYETLLGITLRRQDAMGYEMVWFPMKDGAKGASGALMKGTGYDAGSRGPVIYFTCPDMEEALKRAETVGGKIILPKKAIGEYGFIAWLSDSEGNTIALHKAK